ncbi:hypothetical protein RDI58_004396 [Solanum bulbocastanum]|uniref:DUF4283 domain-containing protein n=1 Tax=Solanum bulbocastanum TaxID=147425 RepID=A0AAN8TYS4_SOLBU
MKLPAVTTPDPAQEGVRGVQVAGFKRGVKVGKLNPEALEQQTRKWDSAVIGYVVGKNTPFKQMLKFVYAIWNLVTAPRVLYDEGYYMFKFEDEHDKQKVLQNGSYTFDSRPVVLKQWNPNNHMDMVINQPETVTPLVKYAESPAILQDKFLSTDTRQKQGEMVAETPGGDDLHG